MSLSMSLTKKNLYIKPLFLLLTCCNQTYLPDDGDRRHRSVPYGFIYKKGTYTIEAAVCMPVFLCFAVFILMYFRILTLQWGIDTAIYEVARESAIYSQEAETDNTGVGIINSNTLSAAAYGSMSNKNIPHSYIKWGVAGLNYMGTGVSERDVEISVQYTVNQPTGMLGKNSWHITQRKRARRWIGYDPHESEDELSNVYVTETGSAYHSTVGCVYLNPSVRAVSAQGIENLRSKDGGKYKACKKCGGVNSSHLYVTDYGEVYHTSITCSGIKRSIRRVTIENAKKSGFHACSKCGR